MQNAEYFLRKTLEMNPYDIEAYKILTKLQLKENDFNNAIETIKTALSECEETGDLDFLASIVFKKAGDEENSSTYFENAIKNHQTLSIPIAKAREEIKRIK